MAFQSPSIDNQQQQHLQSQVQYGQASLDSITLGQLKNMVNAPPKPKASSRARALPLRLTISNSNNTMTFDTRMRTTSSKK
jgi:hypothetical protein